MTREELNNIKGGAINASLLNAIARGLTAFYDLGTALGSALKRLKKKKYC